MIEAGDIGHNGLFIRPQSTHDVYPAGKERWTKKAKKREMEDEAKATQAALLFSLKRM